MSLTTASKVYTVSELSDQLKNTLEQKFSTVWLAGEISNFTHHSSGHMYMTLKDASAQIRLVFFRNANKMIKFEIKQGMQVTLCGQLTVYPPSGQYQISVKYMEPQGVGALQKAFEQLKEKLNKEGLFDPSFKKEIPAFPQKVGLVTSPTGAAIRDMLQVSARRYQSADILLHPARVQGQGAAAEIAGAIRLFSRQKNVDVLIIGRGGGSLEDLWAFNEEEVARAIFDCPIPVISAVGHEIDYTISDFVADLRAPTPSAAAELAMPSQEELKRRLNHNHKLLTQALLMSFSERKKHLQRLAEHRVFANCEHLIQQFMQRLDALQLQLNRTVQTKLRESQQRLKNASELLQALSPAEMLKHQKQGLKLHYQRLREQMSYRLANDQQKQRALSEKLQVLSPLNILSRGYAISFDANSGEVLKDIANLSRGRTIETRLHRGVIVSEVKDLRKHA